MNITGKLAGIAVTVAAAPLLSTTSAQAVTPTPSISATATR
ncbi:hypothetical protein [Nocardia brasiliensis]